MNSQRTQLETVMETVLEVDSLTGSPVTSPGEHLCQRDPSKRPQAMHLGDVNSTLLEQVFQYKRRLEYAETKLKEIRSKRDIELKVIVSRLLLLEGKLIRDKKIVEATLREKDKLIEDLTRQLRRGVIYIDRVDGRVMQVDMVESEEATEMDQQPFNYTRRKSTEQQRLIRDMKSYSSPVASCNAECQTEEALDAFEVVQMSGIAGLGSGPKADVASKVMRSYSNPDDPKENYEKTSDAKVKDKDMIIVNDETVMDTEEVRRDSISRIKVPLMRKKSLSSPDLQLGVETDGWGRMEENNNMVGLQQNQSAQHLHSYYDEVDHSIAASLASPRPSLPLITVQGSLGSHLEWKEDYINPHVACEEDEQQSGGESPRTTEKSGLTKRTKVYLRSYSTPNTDDVLFNQKVDETTATRASSLKLPKDSKRILSSESASYDEENSGSDPSANSVYL